MTSHRPGAGARLRPAVLAVLALTSLLSCGREATGPGAKGRLAEIQFAPVFPSIMRAGDGQPLSIGDVVDFARVRLVLLRTNGDTAAVRVVDFPPDSTSIRLAINVTLSEAATSEGEPFAATLKYVNATGDTVFSGGPVAVIGKPAGSSNPPPPPQIPVTYTGPGANAASIVMTPATLITGAIGQQIQFSAQVFDAQSNVLANTPVAYTSTNPAVVSVNLKTGAAQVLGARGSASVIAQTLTGQADTTPISVPPVPTAIQLVSGGNQQIRQGLAFPSPIVVRAIAADNLPVQNSLVTFAVTRGQGLVSQALDTTDVNGLAQVNWTAGDSAGVGILRAALQANAAVNVQVNGTQLSSAPTALTFETQPDTVPAGNPLRAIRVVVRDATGDTVRNYNGNVTIGVTGGTAGTQLLGERPISAVNGVIVFTGLYLDKSGTGFRLQASIAGGPSAQSNAFDALASLPYAIQLLQGANQQVPPSTALPDSIVARVVDILGQPKAGVAVTFTVLSGGGTSSPTTVNTDANGRAATRWTAGASGGQQLRINAAALTPVLVNANVVTGGGAPQLYLSSNYVGVPVTRTRPITVFLTNPTPSPLTVNFVMRDTLAAWSQPSLVIPQGGAQVTALVTGVDLGLTWGVVSSSAGTDSVQIQVTSLAVELLQPYYSGYLVMGDTIRTFVRINEPAPAGGLTVTVQSTDSSMILVAPASGRGYQEEICLECLTDLRSAEEAPRILAPPAGTAVVTIPEGQLMAAVAILPIGYSSDATVALTVSAAGFAGTGISAYTLYPHIQSYCGSCYLGAGMRESVYPELDYVMRRDVKVSMRSLDPAIAVVLDTASIIPRGQSETYNAMYVLGLSAGTARILTSAPGFPDDTVTWTVYPRRLGSFQSSVSIDGESTEDYYVYAGYDAGFGLSTGGEAPAPIPLTFTSRDPAVVMPLQPVGTIPVGEYYTSMKLRGVGAGSTYVVYQAAGYPADSVFVQVFTPSLYAYNPIAFLGLGHREDGFYTYINGSAAQTITLTVTSDDPNIARVLTPTVHINQGFSQVYFSVLGTGIGSTNLTVSAPGRTPFVMPVQIIQPGVLFSNYRSSPTPIEPDSSQYGLGFYALANADQQTVTDTVRGVIRSTNPAVLLVTDSLMLFRPNTSFTADGAFRAIAPGTARISIDIPGYIGDTTAVITVKPYSLSMATSVQVGNGLIAPVTVRRNAPTGAVLNASLAVTGGSGSSVQNPPATFNAGQANATFNVIGGNTLGEDTVTASAAGFTSASIRVLVVRTKFKLSSTPQLLTGQVYNGFGGWLYGPPNTVRATVAGRKFAIVSRDTSIIKVTADTVEFAAGATNAVRSATLQAGRPGQAVLVATSTDGSADPDSMVIFVQPPRLYSSTGALQMGMEQQTYNGEVFLQRATPETAPLWVKLVSSAPGIASVPDSVLIPANGYYVNIDIQSGDTLGSAEITYTAPGREGGRIYVFVTRHRIESYVYDEFAPGDIRDQDVYIVNDYSGTHETRVPVPLGLASSDTSVIAFVDTAPVMPPGTYYLGLSRNVKGKKVGRSTMTVSDRRTGYTQLTPTAVELYVIQGNFQFWQRDFNVAIGLVSADIEAFAETYRDSVWVKVKTLNGRAVPLNDSLLALDDSYVQVRVRGVSAGMDTIVISTPEGSDTAFVHVADGILRPVTEPPAVIHQGDSTLVTLRFAQQDGQFVSVGSTPIPITFSAPANIDVRISGATVTTTNANPGTFQFSFYVRGIAPGAGTLTVSAPNMKSYQFTLTTRSP